MYGHKRLLQTGKRTLSKSGAKVRVAFDKRIAINQTTPLIGWCDHCLRSPHRMFFIRRGPQCELCGCKDTHFLSYMQIFGYKFAICRIFNGLSKGFTLKTFTRVRDLEWHNCLVRAEKVCFAFRKIRFNSGDKWFHNVVIIYNYIKPAFFN